MSGRVIIIVAILFGLAAAGVAMKLLKISAAPGSAKILVATSDLKPGSEIVATDIKILKWPKASIPLGSFVDSKLLIGRVTKQEVYAGEPLLEKMLAPENSRAGLAATITVGKRAITVKVNEVIAVAGFALPGSYVDVLAAVKDNSGNVYSKTVLKNIKVLAIAQETESDSSKPKVVNAVTLELTPKESETLDVARNAGTLSLTLRNPSDNHSGDDSVTKFGDVFEANNQSTSSAIPETSAKKSKVKSTAKPKGDAIDLIKGNAMSEVAF